MLRVVQWFCLVQFVGRYYMSYMEIVKMGNRVVGFEVISFFFYGRISISL